MKGGCFSHFFMIVLSANSLTTISSGKMIEPKEWDEKMQQENHVIGDLSDQGKFRQVSKRRRSHKSGKITRTTTTIRKSLILKKAHPCFLILSPLLHFPRAIYLFIIWK